MRLLVLDGYANLDSANRTGLSARAAGKLGIAVIGAAKTPFCYHPCHPGHPRNPAWPL
jgi:hypothetical protein